jgi:hypothetical protein
LDCPRIRDCDFLFERLADLANPASPESDQSEFESWRALFDSKTEKLFAQRLVSIGLNEDQAKALFDRPPSESEIPAWYEVLEKASQYQPAEERFLSDFSFAPLWWPFVAYAKEQVFQPIENRSLLSPQATESLANQLLQDICKLAAEATYRVFAQQRAEGVSFDDFVRTTRASRYENLFESFPALARPVAILIS